MHANVSGTVSPSAALAESLAALSASAHQALAEVENRARQDVVKANSDAREAQLERDKALEALHAAQLETQELQKEVANMKATLKQIELSVAHHKETIAQLRREATQWKDQSRNWQEHFLRVEQERCSLTTRNEELVTERLQWTRSLPTPFTPNHPNVDTSLPAVSPKPGRASVSSRKRPISPDVDSPSTSIIGRKSNRAASKPYQVTKNTTSTPIRNLSSHDSTSTANQNSNFQSGRTRQPSSHTTAQSPTRTTVLRRVQAVINVKQEEHESDEELEHLVTDDTPHPKRPPSRKWKVVYHDEDYVSGKESDHASSRSDQSSEYGDNEEVDDEDDELMLGGETHEHKRERASKNAPGSSSKKRRITGGRDKPPTRRKNKS